MKRLFTISLVLLMLLGLLAGCGAKVYEIVIPIEPLLIPRCYQIIFTLGQVYASYFC